MLTTIILRLSLDPVIDGKSLEIRFIIFSMLRAGRHLL